MHILDKGNTKEKQISFTSDFSNYCFLQARSCKYCSRGINESIVCGVDFVVCVCMYQCLYACACLCSLNVAAKP